MTPCNCGYEKCEYWFCRDRKICLIWFESLTKEERSHIITTPKLPELPYLSRNIQRAKKAKAKAKERSDSHAQNPANYKQILLEKTGGKCWLCGKKIHGRVDFSKDHVIPRALGGSSDMDNLMPAHRICNSLRSNRRDIDTVEKFKEFIESNWLDKFGLFKD